MKPIVDREFIYNWLLEHGRCAACHQRWGMTAHHLVKRSRKRMDTAWNLLALCFRCHASAEGERLVLDGVRQPVLTFAHCLWLKREADPGEWNPELLREACGRPLPEPEPVPDYYLQRRRHVHLAA